MKFGITRLPLGLSLILIGWMAGFAAVRLAHPYPPAILVDLNYIGLLAGSALAVFGIMAVLMGKRSWVIGITDLLALVLVALLWWGVVIDASHAFQSIGRPSR